jgi:hypothetical protein
MTTPANQQFTTRTDRLWANNDLDLAVDHVYKIDNVPVLSYTELGLTVTKSNLRQIGTLNTLDVSGDASLAEFAHFNSTFNRLGLGTNEPNASISILDNDVEIAIGSPSYGVAQVGTYSNHNLQLTTDNIARITIKNSGEVVIGDEVGKNGVLRVFGTLQVDNFVADTRIERSSPLEFKGGRDGTVYGLGLVWKGADFTRQLIMRPDPDRLWSSTSIELAEFQALYINGKTVITEHELGQNVTFSNLVRVGTLQELSVAGAARMEGTLEAGETIVKSLFINTGVKNISLNADGINSNYNVRIAVKENDVVFGDDLEIILGNPNQSRRPVKVFGAMSIGVNNPDPELGLSVAGDVSFGGKKFISGFKAPEAGTFNQGDICWNVNPQESSFVGWVCVQSGSPGRWLTFGAIGRQ